MIEDGDCGGREALAPRRCPPHPRGATAAPGVPVSEPRSGGPTEIRGGGNGRCPGRRRLTPGARPHRARTKTGRRAQVKTELSMAYAQEFYSTVRDKCFNKCVTRPSTSLSSSEQACLARCCDRYVEATGVVSKAMLQAGKGME